MHPLTLTTWQSAPTGLSLEARQVHLWRFPLTDPPVEGLLSSDETRRLARLRVAEKATAFVVARSGLRVILGRYLGLAPQDIRFHYTPHGKPFLEGLPLSFNLSHSGTWGVCAVTREADLGVDLEAVNPKLDYEPLARRFFSPRENNWLLATSRWRRRRTFFRLWTRKEAWLKGQGGGFSERTLELDAAHLSGRRSAANGWRLLNLPITRGYVGALAVAGEIETIERWEG
jgi:4'-phosphopantetheinyl transferase